MPLKLSETALRKADQFGYLECEVREMALKAAIFTHPQGNYRFENLIFQIDNSCVEDINVFDAKAFDRERRRQGGRREKRFR